MVAFTLLIISWLFRAIITPIYYLWGTRIAPDVFTEEAQKWKERFLKTYLFGADWIISHTINLLIAHRVNVDGYNNDLFVCLAISGETYHIANGEDGFGVEKEINELPLQFHLCITNPSFYDQFEIWQVHTSWDALQSYYQRSETSSQHVVDFLNRAKFMMNSTPRALFNYVVGLGER